MSRYRRVEVGWLLTKILTTSLCASSYPAPQPPREDSQLGAKIQRTMQLLATSTPEHRNKVKVLFYGQSITVQGRWKDVAEDLRRRFPHADLEIENKAIGGSPSGVEVYWVVG